MLERHRFSVGFRTSRGLCAAALLGAGVGCASGPGVRPFEAVESVTVDAAGPVGEALRDAAEEAARAHGMTVMPRGAEATLSLELQRLDWIIGTGNTVRPRAVVLATMRWPDGVLSRQYQRDGARLAVRDWTADRGAPIPTNIEALFADIAAEIAEDFDGAR